MKLRITSLLFFVTVTSFAQQRIISVDLTKVKGPRSSMYNFCVGAGRANEGLRADWQQQLAAIQKTMPFRYIRFHGILHDDMAVYKEDDNGNPIYNWQYIDKLYDFLLSVNIKPFVELSFMPSALAKGTKTVFWWKANVTEPKDYTKWENLIIAFVKHLEQRYGKKEVESWFFEVWNEPDHPAFLSPNNQETYYKIYASAAKAIKSVSPTYKVGGPATAGSAWVGQAIRYCYNNKLQLDFISTHSYAVFGDGLDEFGKKKLKLIPDENIISKAIKRLRDTINNSAMPKLDLHITEFSSSYSDADPIHDTNQNAPYTLNVLRNTESSATSMSYWTFTDIFEENAPASTPFHGGFGLINLQDIRKPTFYIFKFLAELGNTELINTDSSSIICKDNIGNVQALFWNITMPEMKGSSNKEYFRKDLPAANVGTAELRVRNIKPGKYKLEIYQTGYRVNDSFTAYYDMRLPSQITKEQVAKLKESAAGKPIEQSVVNISGAGFSKNIKMRENDVFFVRITRL